MSQTFINDNFLLENKYAEELYHNYSKNQPIIDYHNHLNPQFIAEDKIFENITQVGLMEITTNGVQCVLWESTSSL